MFSDWAEQSHRLFNLLWTWDDHPCHPPTTSTTYFSFCGSGFAEQNLRWISPNCRFCVLNTGALSEILVAVLMRDREKLGATRARRRHTDAMLTEDWPATFTLGLTSDLHSRVASFYELTDIIWFNANGCSYFWIIKGLYYNWFESIAIYHMKTTIATSVETEECVNNRRLRSEK